MEGHTVLRICPTIDSLTGGGLDKGIRYSPLCILRPLILVAQPKPLQVLSRQPPSPPAIEADRSWQLKSSGIKFHASGDVSAPLQDTCMHLEAWTL